MMKITVLMMVLVTTYGQDTKVKEGFLKRDHGHGKLVSDITIIKLNVTSLLHMEEELIKVESEIESITNGKESDFSVEILLKIKKEISVVTKRSKRSLLPFIGNALNNLFGVATYAQVEKERDRLSKLKK